jgi:type II secretory pathway predicted ATPase ExeA
MYERFFGLDQRPFDLTPNPKFLFLSASHREALANLQYGISARKGLTVLIGEVGTGKTTLVRAALASFSGVKTTCVWLTNPTLTRDEFMAMLAKRFGLSDRAAASKAELLIELEQVLRAARDRDELVALIVDEAQRLPRVLMEEIRLFANIETDTDKLLPLVLVGQPELATRLSDPSLRQLKQRVALRCELAPLQLADTAAYIAARIRVAGGDAARVFTREAVGTIHEYARGVPRNINVICDNALVSGYALGERPVGRRVVLEVCRDFDLTPAESAQETAPGPDAAPVQQGESHDRPLRLQATAASGSAGPSRFRFFS